MGNSVRSIYKEYVGLDLGVIFVVGSSVVWLFLKVSLCLFIILIGYLELYCVIWNWMWGDVRVYKEFFREGLFELGYRG